MDPEADWHLLHIAEWALVAPIPDGWTVHLDAGGQTEYFHNVATGQSLLEHPMDEYYRQVRTNRKRKLHIQRPTSLN